MQNEQAIPRNFSRTSLLVLDHLSTMVSVKVRDSELADGQIGCETFLIVGCISTL
jgi:hypothetical protein